MSAHTTTKSVLVALVVLLALPVAASIREDTSADAIASAFLQARDAAQLPKISRMGRNAFRKQACSDRRFADGLILDVTYKTTDPGTLPEAALKLAARADGDKVTARFGVGVCFVGNDSASQPEYNAIIATYESRWNSFWHAFWE
jgi:hypothetical protein